MDDAYGLDSIFDPSISCVDTAVGQSYKRLPMVTVSKRLSRANIHDGNRSIKRTVIAIWSVVLHAIHRGIATLAVAARLAAAILFAAFPNFVVVASPTPVMPLFFEHALE